MSFIQILSAKQKRSVAGRRRLIKPISIGLLAAGVSLGAAAQTQLLWGDMHLHTNLSTDSYATNNKGVSPDMAYRFARGIPIHHPNLDTKVQIDRPLDFLAITDHAINLGIDVMALNNHPLLSATERGRALIEATGGDAGQWPGFMRYRVPDGNRAELMEQVFSDDVRRGGWKMQVDAAESNYIPGTFTTFFTWEWTSNVPSSDDIKNLHRNVISNASVGEATRFIPFSNADSLNPEDLWAYLDDTSARTGVDFVAIPHNSNISGGLMFPEVDSAGQAIDSQYARNRMRWELLVEVTQVKGTSEIHPALAPADEFANFEIRNKLLAGQSTPPDASNYARTALMRGMAMEKDFGENPYKFGMIGASDGHIGMSSVEEKNFLGKIAYDAKLSDRLPGETPIIFPAWEMSASGLTAVWAEENNRESIFAALKRKEVYGTTGTRISLRVFGGFGFRAQDALSNDIAGTGYRKGVPMGGDLTAAPDGRGVSLLIHASKDHVGANLDRVQVIKGWVDNKGEAQQKVFDVAWSGKREADASGKVPAVGNTVDISTGHYSNSIGAAQLATVWTDPEFDPDQHAFYYVRALEIPTPRHSLYDALALGIPVEETGQPATIQERAYSSPIWYTP